MQFYVSMRKVTFEIEPYETTKTAQKAIFKDIHSYEVLEVLTIDHVKGLFIDLIECRLKDNVSINKLDRIGNMEIQSVIRSEGDRHICLVKGYESDRAKVKFEEEELDLIYTTPSMISEDKVIVSFISGQKEIMKFAEIVRKHVGKIAKMTIKQATYDKKDLLSILTDKQREVMLAAHRHGYYDIPRRITSERLAREVNISKPTLLEHLRKGERRILNEIMGGDSE
jgi:predicted DNA binding protein